MTPAERGLQAIREFEGLRLEAYPDPASGGEPITVGFGHTGGVKLGDKITLEEAEAFLMGDVAVCQDAINHCVNVPLTEGQLWALTSFAFNLGVDALKNSTLVKFLNDGDYLAAADQFPRWIFAGGKPMTGLISRRATERSMFMEGVQEGSHAPVSHPGAESVTTPELPPVETRVPTPVIRPKEKQMLPLIPIFTALLPTLLESIPKLKALFPGGEVSERNVKVAEVAFKVAQEALGAANAQQVVQMVQQDPSAAQTVAKAVEDNWWNLTEAGGGGIEGAAKRDAAFVASGSHVWDSPSFWAMMALVPLIYWIFGGVLGIYGTMKLDPAVTASIITGAVTLVLGSVAGYYFGSTTTKNRPQT